MDNKIVLPGDLVDEKKGRRYGRGTFADGEKVFSTVLGIPRVSEVEVSVIPLSGVYLPVIGDRIIGTIKSVEISGWMVDINSPYPAFLPLAEAVDEYVDTSRADLSRYFDVGDVIFCRISKVTKGMNVQASMRDMMSRKLYGGVTISVTPSKIPRIIGKAGSMVQLIKQKTHCDVYTGQNGLVWIRGEDKAKALETILMIERESHLKGLTEKVEKTLG
jgi:exosome complex component RRP4